MCFIADGLACVTPLRHYFVLARSIIQEPLVRNVFESLSYEIAFMLTDDNNLAS